jgi:hypothetical protein
MMVPIEFSVELTENDIARLYDEVRPYWRLLIPIAYILIVLGIGGVFLGSGSRPAAVAIIAGGLWLVLVPRGFKVLLVRQFRKNPSALGTVRYEFGDDSVKIVSEAGRSELQWQAFLKKKETPGFLCLHLSPITGYVIPLAQITSVQSAQLRELVRSRIPAASGIHSTDIPIA